MPRYLVTTAVDVDDIDPTRCGEECRHAYPGPCCVLYQSGTIGTPEDKGTKPVRCPACVEATNRVVEQAAGGVKLAREIAKLGGPDAT